MPDYPCGKHEAMIRSNKERLDKLDIIIEKVRNRLPIWATVGFGGLTLLIGWLLHYLK